VTLLAVGVLCWLSSRLAARTENHAYSTGAMPPTSVHVTAGRTYHLAYPGGVAALEGQGIDPGSLQCQWSQAGGSRHTLSLVTEPPTTLARNVVASFQADTTGAIHVACDALGAMFVDDADDAKGDPSGWFLLVATLLLTAGVPLTLSGLRGAGPASAGPAGEDEEIERLVDVVRGRAAELEVRDTDGRHVGQ
jgi:hypothetical protein